MNANRRAIDRGHDRDPEVEAYGFMSRLYFSVPGQEIQMRENTTSYLWMQSGKLRCAMC